MRFEKRLDRRQPLRHPRPRIQQFRHRTENRKVDLDPRAAHLLQPRHRGLIKFRGFLVAEELELIRSRHAKAKTPASPRRRAISWTRHARIRIARIAALRHPPHRLRIAAVRRKNRNTIERAARRHYARRAEQATRGLQPDQIVERRRNAPRPRRIGAQRKTHQFFGHRHRRAGTRSAGNIARIEHARARAVRRPRPHQSGGELIQVGFADRDGAGREQPLHYRSAALRRVRISRTARRSGNAGQIDIVLDRERNAVQRQPSSGGSALQFPRPCHRSFTRDQRNPNRLRGLAPDPIVNFRDDVRGLGLALAIKLSQRVDRPPPAAASPGFAPPIPSRP